MGASTEHPAGATGPLTVFYNAECPVCRREIDGYRRYAEARGLNLRWTDVTRDPETLARHGVDIEGQRRSLHAITPDGRLASGVDAFDLLWRRLPRYRWLAALLEPRLMRAAAHIVYDWMLAPALYRLDARRRRRRIKDVAPPHDHQN